MKLPPELTPVRIQRVIDLVADAGIDVGPWAEIKGGPKKAAANPRYCYEWSFVKPGEVVVLNLWYSNLRKADGVVFQELNFRDIEEKYRGRGGNNIIAQRARRMDEAIKAAARDHLPVRVIINAGLRRGVDLSDDERSQVKKRLLDTAGWAVTYYDFKTGRCVVTRGAKPSRFVDQFSVTTEPDGAPENPRRERKGICPKRVCPHLGPKSCERQV